MGWTLLTLVRILGPASIKDYKLECDYDSNTAFANIAYRILSPTILSCIFLSALTLALSNSYQETPAPRWLPVLFYWLFLFTKKAKDGSFTTSAIAFGIEAATSILAAAMFDAFVISKLGIKGIEIFDESSIAFEFEIILFGGLVQLVGSLMARHFYTTYRLQTIDNTHRRTVSPIAPDTSEANLFRLKREYEVLLPLVYKQDPLLWDVFFSIMVIEDFNRPKHFRFFERLASRIGISKTTGIMQQRGDRPLTDEESVCLAAPYVIEMWRRFLRMYARSSESTLTADSFRFSNNWYRYDYKTLARVLEDSFGSLYGDYCGTRLLNASGIFHEVRLFNERNNYNLHCDHVTSSGSLFPQEISWLSSNEAYWETTNKIRCVGSLDKFAELAVPAEDSLAEHVAEACERLISEGNRIVAVDYHDDIYATIFYSLT